jgi:hypothetical protein
MCGFNRNIGCSLVIKWVTWDWTARVNPFDQQQVVAAEATVAAEAEAAAKDEDDNEPKAAGEMKSAASNSVIDDIDTSNEVLDASSPATTPTRVTNAEQGTAVVCRG